jgi:hypothetical protein
VAAPWPGLADPPVAGSPPGRPWLSHREPARRAERRAPPVPSSAARSSGSGLGLLVVAQLLPRRLRPVDRRRLSVAAAACLAVGAVALETLR